jgi:hypothetical protein
MAYDLVTGEIVVKGYQQLSIKLNPVKVDYFLLRGHFFINGGNDNGSAESSPGFYEILYNGAVKLYARRWKQVERATNAADPYVFKSYNYYFIEKEKKYHGIEGKRDFLKLFADRQQALKSFWKNKKLDFKKSKEQSIIQTVAFLCS